jgi:hypothetical protein
MILSGDRHCSSSRISGSRLTLVVPKSMLGDAATGSEGILLRR